MKKFISLLLVLALVSGAVFAGFSGNAKVELGYDLETTAYGLKNSKAFSVDVNFLEQLVGEAKGEGDIYAEIKATLKFNLNNGDEAGIDTNGHKSIEGIAALTSWSAKIIGDGWYVGILEAPRAANFATSAIDSKDFPQSTNDSGYDRDDKTYYADVRPRDYFDRISSPNAGIEIGVAGAKIGLGLIGQTSSEMINLFGSVVSPEFEVADGIKLTAGASGSYNAQKSGTQFEKTGASFSLKGAYAVDDIKASVAADLVYFNNKGVTADDDKINADVALNVQVAPVALDVYYATELSYKEADSTFIPTVDNLLSAKAVADLNGFDVPVKVTVTGKDLINSQDLSLAAAISLGDGLTVTPKGGYVLKSKVWNVGADVEYKTDAYTAKLGTKYSATAGTDNTSRLQLTASVESSAIINGATLALAYTDADRSQNLFNGNATAKDLGSIVASAKIAF
ncbi:hypothetical protein [Parasphaerochaeta coccoides]|uniref:Porin domain-containing protein n=1 Tax=Parasphaerochaeta coccoides (strain ATCC BAA-1237 / DSM 17374 / SPN1) TaxID=760011 RepID=F4GHR5_PARC1|nr:hypothetical protein [Parasphaerochaeta coccoides]AEC01603.1 hypothetical protein Spico_0374 [Parasphaerochaeta coccoides DSM 17374]